MTTRKILSIETDDYDGDTYNLHVEKNHNYFANGVLIKNCHKGQGISIQSVFNNATTVQWKSGWTGTLSNDTLGELTAESIMGPIKEIIQTHELMDKGIVARLTILCTKFKYPEEICNKAVGLEYTDEIKYLESSKPRMNKLISIVGTQSKTGLILYRHIKHGEKIRDAAITKYPHRNIYFIHGNFFELNGKKFKKLEELFPIMEQDPSGIIIANYQVFSTGLSIKNMHWIIFGAPAKSYTTVIQSIGRGLRVSAEKKSILLIDIVDDLSIKIKRSVKLNYAMKHFYTRFEYYNDKKFEYKVHNIQL